MKKIILAFIIFTSLTFGQAWKTVILMGNNAVVATPADTIPSAFTFTDVTDVDISTWHQTYIVVAGCDSARFTISSGDSLKLDLLGTYDVDPIWADAGDSVYVSQIASTSYSTAVVCTLTASGVSDIYSVTTMADPYGVELVTNGAFTSDVTSWTGTASTLKHYATDWIGAGRVGAALDSATSTSNSRFTQTYGVALTSGTTYRVKFDYYLPSSNTYTDGIQCYLYGTASQYIPSITALSVTNAWTSITYDITLAENKTVLTFRHLDGGSSTLGGAGGVFLIDNVSIKEVL